MYPKFGKSEKLFCYQYFKIVTQVPKMSQIERMHTRPIFCTVHCCKTIILLIMARKPEIQLQLTRIKVPYEEVGQGVTEVYGLYDPGVTETGNSGRKPERAQVY